MPECQPAYVTERLASDMPWKLTCGLATSKPPVYFLAMVMASSLESAPEPRNMDFLRGRGTSSPRRAASSISFTLKYVELAWIRVSALS
jgi:hypothetical protein